MTSCSCRRQSALISEEKKFAPTDVGGYTLRPFSPKREMFALVPRQISFVTSCRARVGRVTPCAPRSADSFPNGAHGVTRPTRALHDVTKLTCRGTCGDPVREQPGACSTAANWIEALKRQEGRTSRGVDPQTLFRKYSMVFTSPAASGTL